MQQKMEIQDGSNDKKYFTIIPNYILNHSTMWDREVYIQMKRIAGEDGTCWTSQKTLSSQCGISVNRLKKSLGYLLEHKWIKGIGTKRVYTAGGTQQVNEYKIADLWKININFYEDKGVSPDDIPLTKGVSPIEPKGYHQTIKGVSPDDDKEEPLKNITIKKSRNFVPPSLAEVKDYCLIRKNSIDAEQFIDFYESKGWLVGKTSMKDWRASVRTWEKRDRQSPQKVAEKAIIPNYAKDWVK